jgi:hypothetical protein
LTSCDLEIIALLPCAEITASNLPSSTWPLCISELDTLTWYSIRRRGVVYDIVLQGTMITRKNHVVKSDLVTMITTPILKATGYTTSPIFPAMPFNEGYMKAGASDLGGGWTNLES